MPDGVLTISLNENGFIYFQVILSRDTLLELVLKQAQEVKASRQQEREAQDPISSV